MIIKIAIIIGILIDIFTLYCCIAASKADDVINRAWEEEDF